MAFQEQEETPYCVPCVSTAMARGQTLCASHHFALGTRSIAGNGRAQPFSHLVLKLTTYQSAGECQVPANMCKAEQPWPGITG
jgi:hypothetical protein